MPAGVVDVRIGRVANAAPRPVRCALRSSRTPVRYSSSFCRSRPPSCRCSDCGHRRGRNRESTAAAAGGTDSSPAAGLGARAEQPLEDQPRIRLGAIGARRRPPEPGCTGTRRNSPSRNCRPCELQSQDSSSDGKSRQVADLLRPLTWSMEMPAWMSARPSCRTRTPVRNVPLRAGMVAAPSGPGLGVAMVEAAETCT